jgi:hypothetical protein
MTVPLTSLLLFVGALLLAGAASVRVAVVGAAEVRLTSGAENIEANFPAQTAAAADTLAASAAASGYPSRSLVPLRATVTPEAATLMSQAVTAFKASQKSFDVRFDNAVSSPELKKKFFNEGKRHGEQAQITTQASERGRMASASDSPLALLRARCPPSLVTDLLFLAFLSFPLSLALYLLLQVASTSP